ncbi:MAG TPA: 5'-nucleotidase [Acidimicrobiia bacterium]|nr:5'-nucleotidase [Acidimicrobiia bacterium]
MAYSITDKLVVGLTSRALFDLEEADAVFKNEGIAAYRAHQLEREAVVLEPGTAFSLASNLLRINELANERLVEVVVISRNDADSGMRILNSVEAHGLDITRAAFTDGKPPWPFLGPFSCNLFLSAHDTDVEEALRHGWPAALVLKPARPTGEGGPEGEVRIAFDGDAVLFDHESEHVYQTKGLEAFVEREVALSEVPMSPGPFKPFLESLARVQQHFPAEEAPIRLALVTARGAPAHRRVVHTLRQWGIRLNETFFLGGIDKAGVLAALKPHIYFDDQMTHLQQTQVATPSAHVVPLNAQPALPFGPSGSTPDGGEALSVPPNVPAESRPERRSTDEVA